MTYFEHALLTPELHFRRLGLMKVVRREGERVLGRTQCAMEAEVVWNDRHYLIFLPFREEYMEHIMSVEATLRERSLGPLINNNIFTDELLMLDSVGVEHYCDVILQEIPKGMPFNMAIGHYKAADLRKAVNRMKTRLDNIGFNHRNLRPENVVVCDDGVLRPLRYWHAKWEELADNNISRLIAAIDEQCGNPEFESVKASLVEENDAAVSTEPTSRGEIICYCRNGRYGFIDRDGVQITKFEYSWASDFVEGRAVVAKNGKMGAINSLGRKVIPVQYEYVSFDVKRGEFHVRNGKFRYLYNYDGKQICRIEEPVEEECEVKA